MKHILSPLLILVFSALACNLPLLPPTTAYPTVTEPSLPPTKISVPNTPASGFSGQTVTYDHISLSLPIHLATSGIGQSFPRAEGENIAPWEITPGHIVLTLNDYTLKNTFHAPRIYVFPAQEYAALFEGAQESLNRLQNILAAPNAPVTPETLPFIPFFNAGAQFSAQIRRIAFQNGAGVRFLTQYGQDISPINNQAMFYQFQGLTNDGKFYVITILPANHPTLPADYTSMAPPGGIPFPDYNDPNADFMGYYEQIAQIIDASAGNAFIPSLETLDMLIQSIQITP